MSDKLRKKNTTKIVQKFYCSSNTILNNFNMLVSTDLKKLHTTFCTNVYSSELLKYSNKYIESIYVAYRKVTRRIYKLSYRTHKFIVNALDTYLVLPCCSSELK